MRRFLTVYLAVALLAGMLPSALAAPDWVADSFQGRAAFSENGKCGFMDEEGRVVVEAIYDQVYPYQNDYARVSRWVGQELKYGLLDLEGREVLPVEYDWVGELSEGLRPVYLENRRGGYMDAELRLVIGYRYSETGDFTNGYAIVAVDDENGRPLRGAIDATGREVVPTAYLGVDVERWRDKGLALVQTWEETYGAVSLETAEEVWPCEYRSIEALTMAMEAGSDTPDLLWERVKAAGEDIGLRVDWYPEYETITRLFGLDRMALKRNGLFGLFTLEGEPVTGCVFDAIGQPLSDGTMAAMKGGKWGRIDRDGSTAEDFIHPTREEAEHPVNVQILQKDGVFAIAEKSGRLLTGYDYWNAKPFVNGYAALQNSEGLWGFIDGNGEVAVPFRYKTDSSYIEDIGEDGFAIVQTYDSIGAYVVNSKGEELFETAMAKVWRAGQGMWGFSEGAQYGLPGNMGFADSNGNVVIEPKYVYYTSLKGEREGGIFDQNGIARVYEAGGVEKYIDTTGAEVPPTAASMYPLKEGMYWRYSSDGKCGFLDSDGETVIPFLYDAVSDFDCGCASVRADGIYGILKNPILCSDWAEEELAAAEKDGYVTGRCRLYRQDNITRLQFAELAVNYLEKTTGTTLDTAKDDAFIDTADESVLKAYAAGIVQGRGEGRFDPDGLLTRQELSAMLYRTMGKAGVDFSEVSLDLDAYTDGGQVDGWAREAMSALVGSGVLQGTGENSLSPKDSCTVEQAILLTYRAAQ